MPSQRKEWPPFPCVQYGWRLPHKRIAWKLSWWLMRHVVLSWMTAEGQAREIYRALGAYAPDRVTVINSNTTGSNATLIKEVKWATKTGFR